MWIIFTIVAAFMQAWRNAFQNQLAQDINVTGVTLARFLWAAPIAAVYLALLHLWHPVDLPTFTSAFSAFVLGAAVMQIIATALMVKLFQMNNFAIGAGLAKSEALVAAILGVIFFGTHLSALGWLGVTVGGIAVFLLSGHQNYSVSAATVTIGLLCGIAFALTSLWVREASLCLDIPFPHRAAWVLLLVISLQTMLLVSYLLFTDKATIQALLKHKKLTLLTSTTSCLGSIGWFSAMSLQTVPYVKTLGQIEVFFMMAISMTWLKQKLQYHEIAALLFISIAAILVIWG